MPSNRSIEFFDKKFQKQAALDELTPNPLSRSLSGI